MAAEACDPKKFSSAAVRPSKPQWFGSAVSLATNASSEIPFNPFPQELRLIMAPHIEKATKRRKEAMAAIRKATGDATYDMIMNQFLASSLSKEGSFRFNKHEYPLREAFKSSCGLPATFDISQLHNFNENKTYEKLAILRHLTIHPLPLQAVYDEFVRHVCCPR